MQRGNSILSSHRSLLGRYCVVIRTVAILFCFIAVVPVSAADITVTAVRLRPAEGLHPTLAEITINGELTIKEIEIRTVGGRLDVRFPEYISRRGRVYPQIRLVSRQAHDAVYAALTAKTPSRTSYSSLSYAVTEWKIITAKSKIKAVATVSFNDAVAIECKVIATKFGLWVAWPARQPSGGGKWIDQVNFLDARLKDAITKDILRRHQQSQDNSS
ncbi:MAG: hypothetical protein NTU66_03515 [Elusimicrobia bacterium]|nr:hypothetical protein [Elusimicrobiota bacterium]